MGKDGETNTKTLMLNKVNEDPKMIKQIFTQYLHRFF